MSQFIDPKDAFTLNQSMDASTVFQVHYAISAKIENLSDFMADYLQDTERHAIRTENLSWMAETIKDLQAQQNQCFYLLMKLAAENKTGVAA